MAKAKTVHVRVLAPFMVPHLGAGAGDVIEVDESEAKDLEAGGAVELTDDPTGTFQVASDGPKPTPLPVHSGPYDPPEGAKEMLDAGEGGNTPPAEPLPVGSGPYEAPEAAKEQLDAGPGAEPVPFEPLPVADESETVEATDATGNANPAAVDEQIGGPDPDEMTVADLRAELEARGLDASGNKATLQRRLAKDLKE